MDYSDYLDSEHLFGLAKKYIPGGVNSPVRAFKGVGGTPVFFQKGSGAYLTDVKNIKYLDYVGSWGALILGHAHPKIVQSLIDTLHNGTSFGAPCELEIKLAQKIIDHMPSIEKIRMVNSGTESTMTAIRLARAYTKKNKIIKFNGCYHGHHDAFLVKAGSGLLTLGIPASGGVPASYTEHTLVADFNNLEDTTRLFEKFKNDIAGIIVEPIAGNMGFVLPDEKFLPGLRNLCDKYNALLIFDEVMTGFRVGLGGAQALYKIIPDLTTLGKIIGGGLPVGAIGGRAEILDILAPEGMVYQAGTLSGNPLAMTAGLNTLLEVEKHNFYTNLSNLSNALIHGLKEVFRKFNIHFTGDARGGMFGFKVKPELFKTFYHEMLKKGIYFAPSMYEAGFISSAHTFEDIEKTIKAAQEVLSKYG